MKYFLDVISLEGCPYSREVENILEKNTIPYELSRVNVNEKNNYKTNLIQTFPQIYLKNISSKGKLLLGGNSDFKEILSKNKEQLDKQKINLKNKYPNFSNKTILRIIELFQ